MLLPSKAIAADQALISVGAQVLLQLDRPGTVSAVWTRLLEWREQRNMRSSLPFWWFALSLDTLFAIGAVELHNGELTRTRRAA
ncbi:ABC-three component system middle component 6 [Micromonospora sp. Rc5]|uniref:ABC-three component system middle component 6 n=1 Tax=unclassified Micromonospora TaxID=2617518 RepID=UPI00098D69CA|nr:hypothetical protein BSA16_17930 [Micromonospora sp. Rc5]